MMMMMMPNGITNTMNGLVKIPEVTDLASLKKIRLL
jgi:hypothetical protein